VGYNIKNIGARASIPCKCKVYFYKLERRTTFQNGHASTGESWSMVKFHDFTVLALRSNQSMPGTLRFYIPSEARGLKVIMKVDFEDVMIEAKERNNEKENTWE